MTVLRDGVEFFRSSEGYEEDVGSGVGESANCRLWRWRSRHGGTDEEANKRNRRESRREHTNTLTYLTHEGGVSVKLR